MSSVSRLRQVPVREVWRNEARDFTQWMLLNADVLADVLGMDIELTAAEHPVGGFSLDIIGLEVGSDHVVIVENQLETTNHTHLGQLLTYAGGTDPKTIVWCAPKFRDEHRAALDWLNENTTEGIRFFGVEVSAVQIDDSRPAPLFRVVAQPNDWSKQVHAEANGAVTMSNRNAAYKAFWETLLTRLKARHPDWTRSTQGRPQGWFPLSYGNSNIWYALVFSQAGPRVEIYFGSPDAEWNEQEFNKVASHRDELDQAFGAPLSYDPLPGKKACRIHVDRPEGGSVMDPDTHDELIEWFITTFERLRPATQEIRRRIENSETS